MVYRYTLSYEAFHNTERERQRVPQRNEDPEEINNEDHNDDHGDNDDAAFDFDREVEQCRRSNALGILKIKDEAKIPQTVVESIVKSTTQVVNNSVDVIQHGLQQCLQNAGLQIDDIPGIEELFEESSSIREPFKDCHNEASQLKYYKENLGMVEPEKIVLGRYHKKVRKGSKLVDVEKEDKAYYVPLIKSIQQLLTNEAVVEEINHPHNRDDGLMADYCDGEEYQAHPLFSQNRHTLQIFLFFDELEVCNPLGSRANTHKIGNFYYTLGNISPDKRSSLGAIMLVAIVNSKHLKEYGVASILNTIMEDIRLLEEGVEFDVCGEKKQIKGTIRMPGTC
ncbi:uncharacterized protein LOC114543726 [Dendronephthya gigantea]|uniref:uncharacterized protein LOC114543726 n=1 Tax=Dendronephthya gigantea TaxID=151771 RepID=UPI00106D3EA8|nr:uncharacterized protein LOC114543726 [Dendronephthya gigantea]